jgi:MFS family permease
LASSFSTWSTTARVCIVNVLFAAGLYSHGFLYNFYLDALGLSARVLGNAAASLTLGGLLALLPAGWLTDRVGARRVYYLAALILAVGLGCGALVENPLPIYAAATLAGAGTALWRVAMSPLLMQASPAAQRARTFSWNVALLVGSGALWTVTAGAAPDWIAGQTGWSGLQSTRAALLIGAFGSLVGLILLITLGAGAAASPERANPEPESSAPNLRSQFRVPPRFIAAAGWIGVFMIAGALAIPFVNLYFHQQHGLAVGRVGALFAVAQIIGALALVGSGELSTRLGAARVLFGWSILFGPLLWLLGAAQALWLAALVYVVQSVVAPATNALIDQLLMERAPPDRRGAVSTWRNAATEGSGFAGASLGGQILERFSFTLLFAVAGAVAVVGSIGLTRVLRSLPPALSSVQPDAAAQQSKEPLAGGGSE